MSYLFIPPLFKRLFATFKKFIFPALAYLLLHEIGHIFDYEHGYNDSGEWTSISWKNLDTPLAKANFKLRNSICLNNCRGKYIPINKANELYTQMYHSGFISQLAAINAMEDFAESFSAYVMSHFMDIHLQIRVSPGKTYSLDEALNSSAFKAKRKFLKRFK